MTSLAETDNRVVALARGMRDLVEAEAAESERMRTLTPAIVNEMWASGLMSSFNPVAAGGVEPSFTEMIETWIEMAWQDGSFGWVGIANLPSSFAAAAYLPDEGFAEVFTAHDNRVTMGGQFFPNGQGTAVDGGYLLNGAWSFGREPVTPNTSRRASSRWTTARCAGPAKASPRCRWPCFHAQRSTSKTAGMSRGSREPAPMTTASRTSSSRPPHLWAVRREPYRGASPATRMGMMPTTAAGHASWALGVAKSMLDDVQELAATKYRMSDMESLASRPTFQKGLAHHRASWRAAHLLVLDAFTTAEAAVAAGEELTPALRADMRVAAVYATDTARNCAEWAHLVAGTSSIREGSRLERAFRDVYTGTQHAFISEKVAIDAAQIWLGIIEDKPGL